MTIIFPEIKSIISPDLDNDKNPQDPLDCSIPIEVEIGIKGKEGADLFQLTVVTIQCLQRRNESFWGKGYLITPSFSWNNVKESLEKMLMHCSGESWNDVAIKISSFLEWEFENYKKEL